MRETPELVHDLAGIPFDRPGKHHYRLAFHLDSSWGYSLVPLTVINGLRPVDGAPPPGVAAFGGTHGNEYEGQVAIKRLCRELNPEEMCGRLILMPQLSESACTGHTRLSRQDGVNMNRAFPGDPHGTLSYRIADFVKRRVFPQVRVVLDIHSGGNEAVFPVCTSFHPLTDAAQHRETAQVAALFDTPFIFVYSRQMASGLLTDEAEDEGKITLGGEFGFGESVSPQGVRHAYEGIKNVLRHYRLLPGEIVRIDPKRTTPPRLVQAPHLRDYIPCPCDGIWEPAVAPGALIDAGDTVGWLHDFADHTQEPLAIRAHRAGIVIALYFAAVCRKGTTLFVIGETVPDRI
jgi:predicted deacylase